MTGIPGYSEYDGLGLAELVRKSEVTPAELVEEAVRRLEALNPKLNAVIYPMVGAARKTARGDLPNGPFQGVPFLLKDLLADVAGAPSYNGSRFLDGYVPDHDCEMVRRFKAAGVVVLGKTNVPEYGLLPVTEPALFGPTRNPWDLTRTPGGSSGGSAAAVAARIVPLAHGSDGGGSIRTPASCCGLFGLKPTRGRNPLGPDLSEAWQGFVCDHVLTRSVRDSAAMLDATAGPDVGAPYYAPPPARPFLEEVGRDPGRLRIAFSSRPLTPGVVDAECLKALEKAVALCRELGHEVEEATPQIDGERFAEAFLLMVCVETRAVIDEVEAYVGRKATAKDYEPVTWATALLGQQVSATEFAKAVHLLKRTGREVGPFFEDYDVFMTPTLGRPPVETRELLPQGAEAVAIELLGHLNARGVLAALRGVDSATDRILEFMPYTALFNATGQPAMSVPLHWTETGLPVGIQFVGRYADEATLFRLAGQLEAAQPWADRVPPIRG
jgi:amidase